MAEDVAIDFNRAGRYIDDYYTARLEIAKSFIDSADRAVFDFFHYSSIKEEKVEFSIMGLLVDTVFAYLPHAGFIKGPVGKLSKAVQKTIEWDFLEEASKDRIKAIAEKWYETAEDFAKDKVKGAIKSDSGEDNDNDLKKVAVKVNDEIGKWRRAWIGLTLFERYTVEKCLDLIYDNKPEKRGKLLETFKAALGSVPTYNIDSLERFQKIYEMGLYKQFWQKKGYWTMTRLWTANNTYFESMTLEVIPNAVGERVRELMQMPTVQSALASWLMRVEVEIKAYDR